MKKASPLIWQSILWLMAISAFGGSENFQLSYGAEKNSEAKKTRKDYFQFPLQSVKDGNWSDPQPALGLFSVETLAQRKTKKARKKNPAFAPIKVNPKLPNVLLIGDSISIGYTPATRKFLAGKANVHRIPTNGGPTIRGLNKIKEWVGDRKWDVIHFNWGLHDLKMDGQGKHQVPLEQYEKNLRELVKYMKPRTKTLIWASTTPVPDGKVKPPRKDADVKAYNAVAKKIMEANGVQINDLYSYILPKLSKLQRPVNVHFTPAGSEVLARGVASRIEKALEKK